MLDIHEHIYKIESFSHLRNDIQHQNIEYPLYVSVYAMNMIV